MKYIENPRKAGEIAEWTNNSAQYNKAIKFVRDVNCEIRCGLCPYNRGCNCNGKWYGEYPEEKATRRGRYPSWKLASKNRKQWMKKNLKKTTEYSRWQKALYTQIEIKR